MEFNNQYGEAGSSNDLSIVLFSPEYVDKVLDL